MMNIENEIFQRSQVDFSKLEKYGFEKKKEYYYFSKSFMNNMFQAEIRINEEGKLFGKVYDLEACEEYTAIRIEKQVGEFVNSVREEYKSILIDIKKSCFQENYFISEQTNRITKYILEKYADEPEFLWEKFPNYAIFRNKQNGKWYGAIMNIDKSKLGQNTGKVEVIDVKVEEDLLKKMLKKKGFYPGYHMNKKNWLTIVLDDTVSDQVIEELIDYSYHGVSEKEYWIVPANPKYYDIEKEFEQNDTILWKQSSDIHVGDIVYIYMAVPYSTILYKCQALEVNIPYEYKDQNVSMSRVMRLKLEKTYQPDKMPFTKLKELGIKAIRGPRKISEDMSKQIDS